MVTMVKGAREIFRRLAILTLLPAACSGLAFAGPDSITVPAEQVNSIFDVANEEYKAGNFENAITLYEGLLSGPGAAAADIHYNIGNASFELKNYGGAIASYRRALRLAPRDQDITANLRFVRQATVDKIDQPRSAEFLREVFFFHYGLSADEAEKIFLGVYVAAALFGAAYLFRKPRMLKWPALVALFLAIVFGASCALRWRVAAVPNQAVVVAEETSVHTGPGHNYLVSFNLHDGAELKIRKLESEWYQVELPDGRRGWIEQSHIEII